MTWAKIDDRAPHHRKLRDAGAEAAWLWVCGLCWANGQHTDGFVRTADLPCLYPGKWNESQLARHAATLVRVGSWIAEADGFRIHDYQQYQSEAGSDALEIRRAKDAARKDAKRKAERAALGLSADPDPVTPPSVRGLSADMSADMSADKPPDTPRTVRGQSDAASADISAASAVSRPPARARAPALPSRPVPARPAPSAGEGERALRDALATAWRVGFVRRFERLAGGTHGGPAGGHMSALIDAALAQPDALAFVDRALDGFFATPRHVTSRPAFPVKYLVEDPVGYAACATAPAGETEAQATELVRGIPRLEVM